jgi:hypothetical protein
MYVKKAMKRAVRSGEKGGDIMDEEEAKMHETLCGLGLEFRD